MERPVGGEEIHVLEGRALIEHLVGGKRAGHAVPHKSNMAGRFGLQSHALPTLHGWRTPLIPAFPEPRLQVRRNERIGPALMTAPIAQASFARRHLLTCEELTAGEISCTARSGRQGRRQQSPDQQEARRPARAHADQPVLRGLDPHAKLLRAGRQAPRRRRHEHERVDLVRAEGRDADRHGHDAQRHAARHPGRAPSRGRRGGAAGAEGRLLGDQCRRRRAPAPDAGAARRAHHPPRQGTHRRADGGHLRRHRCIRASPAPTSTC